MHKTIDMVQGCGKHTKQGGSEYVCNEERYSTFGGSG